MCKSLDKFIDDAISGAAAVGFITIALVVGGVVMWAFSSHEPPFQRVGLIDIVTGPSISIRLESGELVSFAEHGVHDARSRAGVWVFVTMHEDPHTGLVVNSIDRWSATEPARLY